MRFLGSALAALAFVGHSGTHLTLDGKPWRFGGANIEWLGVSNYGPASPAPPRWPRHAEVDQALTTAKRLDARVVRAQTLADSVGCEACLEPTLGTYNAGTFAHMDYAIASARKHGLRVIATFIGDDAETGGGGCVYLAWRNIDAPDCTLSHMDPFFTDPRVIGDVEAHIATILNHVNAYTHVPYKNDPTILGWDLINGGGSPPAWTATVANFVRSIDRRHLILSDASNARLKNVDACVSFIYPHWHQGLSGFAQPRIDACARAHKPYIAYEYGWDRTNWKTVGALRAFLASLQRSPEIAGDAFWALELRSRPIPADITDPQLAASGESGEWWALYSPPRATLVNSAADMKARTDVIVQHNRTMASVGHP